MSRIPFNRRAHGFKQSKNGSYSNRRAFTFKLSTVIIWIIIGVMLVVLFQMDPSADMIKDKAKVDNPIGSIF